METYQRSQEAFRERVFSHDTLVALLQDAGFTVEAVFADDTMNPPKQDTQRLVYVTRLTNPLPQNV